MSCAAYPLISYRHSAQCMKTPLCTMDLCGGFSSYSG